MCCNKFIKVTFITFALLTNIFAYGQRLNMQNLPKILSNVDEFSYKAALQSLVENNFEQSIFFQRQVHNKILVPWLQYHWLVSPNNTATLEQYRQFLDSNRNHPFAQDVYVAGKNKYGNALFFNKQEDNTNNLALFEPNGAKIQAPEVPYEDTISQYSAKGSVEQKINNFLRQGQYSKAYDYLSKNEARQNLSLFVINEYKLKLARLFFNDGEDTMALNAVQNIVKDHGDFFGEAWWIAGLSAWRQQEFDDAKYYFTELSKRNWFHENLLYGGYFWLARVNFIQGDFEAWHYNLTIAANSSNSFYSQIAQEILAKDNPYDYNQYTKRLIQLLLQQSNMQTFLALLQIGADEWAKIELWHQIEQASPEQQSVLLWFAFELDFTYNKHRDWLIRRDTIPDSNMLPRLPFRWQYEDRLFIDEALLLAIIQKESKFQTRAKSGAGAYGLMQITEQTKKTALRLNNLQSKDFQLYNPKDNVYVGQLYLEHLLSPRQFNNDLFATLAAWNAGPTNARGWLRDEWRMHDDPLFWIESIPFKETRLYVKDVVAYYWQYQKRIGLKTTSLTDVAEGKPVRYHAQK